MNEDEKVVIYNKGFQSGKEHSQPSLETKNFMEESIKIMAELKNEIENINEQLQKIPNRDEVKLYVREAIDSSLKCADEKYATKERVNLLEKVVYGAVGVLLAAIVMAIFELIRK